MRAWIAAVGVTVGLGVGVAAGVSPIEHAWLGLTQSSNQCEDVFDYFPNGGVRVFWCHASGLLNTSELAQMAGMSIWSSGPHSVDRLDLKSQTDFGHYNPDFVRWMGDHLIPAEHDSALRARTQPIYDQSVAPLARIMYQTHMKLTAEPGCALAEQRLYEAAIGKAKTEGADNSSYYERWFYFLNPDFCSSSRDVEVLFNQGFDGGVDGNIVKTSVGFWLRREMDGTDAAFAQNLVRLLKTYDAAWLSSASYPKAEPVKQGKDDAGKKKGKKGKKGKKK